MRVEVLIIVSNMTVDLLMDAFSAMIRGVPTNIYVGVLVNVFGDVMTAFMTDPLEDFRC